MTKQTKNGKTYHYDYARPAIQSEILARLNEVADKLGQKPKALLERILVEYLERNG